MPVQGRTGPPPGVVYRLRPRNLRQANMSGRLPTTCRPWGFSVQGPPHTRAGHVLQWMTYALSAERMQHVSPSSNSDHSFSTSQQNLFGINSRYSKTNHTIMPPTGNCSQISTVIEDSTKDDCPKDPLNAVKLGGGGGSGRTGYSSTEWHACKRLQLCGRTPALLTGGTTKASVEKIIHN